MLPRPCQEEFAHGGLLTHGRDGCLWLLPLGEWEREQERIGALKLGDQRGAAVARLLSHGELVHIDCRGRILLPAALRAYAAIARDVVVWRAVDRLEIWSASRWQQRP